MRGFRNRTVGKARFVPLFYHPLATSREVNLFAKINIPEILAGRTYQPLLTYSIVELGPKTVCLQCTAIPADNVTHSVTQQYRISITFDGVALINRYLSS